MLLFGGMWTLGLWIRNTLEYLLLSLKLGLMARRNIEHSGADSDLKYGGLTQEVSSKNDSKWSRDYS